MNDAVRSLPPPPPSLSARRRVDEALVETRVLARAGGRRARLLVFRKAPPWSFVHWALPIARALGAG